MRYRVSVTERVDYLVDVQDLLILLAQWKIRPDHHLQDFGTVVESEYELIEVREEAGGGVAPQDRGVS